MPVSEIPDFHDHQRWITGLLKRRGELSWDDVARLANLHLVLHPAVGALLDAAPALLRRLTSTTTRVTESGLAGIRGPIDWPATGRLRLLERTPAVVTHHVPRTAAPRSPVVLSMPQSAVSRRTCGESAKRQGTARSRKRGGHSWRSDYRA